MPRIQEFKILAVEILGEKKELDRPITIHEDETLCIQDGCITITRVDLSRLETKEGA